MSKAVVSEIHIYPVKSLRGIMLDKSAVAPRGMENDRRWMVTDDEGVFITQRRFPEMATLRTEFEGGDLLLSSDKGSCRVDPGRLEKMIDRELKTVVWDDEVRAVDAGEDAATFLSDSLGHRCRLVYMPDRSKRPVSKRLGEHIVSFADAYPVLAASVSSLESLNSHLEVPVPIERFRPNLVISGLEPFEEDNWKEVKIGEARFLSAKPCARCVVTTIDQQAGEKTGKEPLRTLSEIRRAADVLPDRFEILGFGPNDALFGQNLIPLEGGGVVKIGDEVEVLARY